MEYAAHKRETENSMPKIQTVAEHCRRTAEYARSCLSDVGLSEAGYLAGLVHDAGKCKTEFQDYLFGKNLRRGSVNHTFAGCRILLERYHSEENLKSFRNPAAELLAFAAGAHHGLFDCVDTEQKSGFLHRLHKEDIGYSESRENFLFSCAGLTELDERFDRAEQELTFLFGKLFDLAKRKDADKKYENHGDELSFYLGLTARLLLSAVIEGDRRDTAEFMIGAQYRPEPENRKKFWEVYLCRTEDKLAAFPNDTPLQKARGEISEACRSFAERPGGVYRLYVPTGGGKTLSSLRYALAHAAQWGKKRILFVTPLLSILEQNAKVIRDFIGEDEILLEHHSNLISAGGDQDALDPAELAVENWHAPVIITTLVQLLNTFFSGKTAAIRRFQSLCDAVIVIDEVQTVPLRMLTLFNLMVNFLSEICGATFLFTSATQPCLERAAHPLLKTPEDLVSYRKELFAPFYRTVITDAGARRLEEIPDFVREVLREADSLLVICNKKSEAEFLFRALSKTEANCYHLSAAMCTAHRRKTLEEIRLAMDETEYRKSPLREISAKSAEDRRESRSRVLCIATQVIESGVDISFQRVIRLCAGMDSVIQAAGRCNRNGENPTPVPVYLVTCADENLKNLGEIRRGKTVTTELLENFRHHPEDFDEDLSSDRAIRWYYRKLYTETEKGFQDYHLADLKNTLFSLLEGNTAYHTKDCGFYNRYSLVQAFRTAGERFSVFDEDTEDVVVPYGEGAKLIEELTARPQCQIDYLKDWTRRAKPYTVALYEHQKKKLAHALYAVNGVLLLSPEAYDGKTGLFPNEELPYLEV